MKNFIVYLFISIISATGFAADSGLSQKDIFRDKAIDLLYKNMNAIKLEGDVKANEKLQPIFEDVADFYAYVFGSLFSGDDDDDGKDVKLSSAVPLCENLERTDSLSRCEIRLVYKTGQQADVVYYVHVANHVPVSVVENKATIHRSK